MNDGAAALILASAEAVKKHGLTARARVLGMASAGVAPRVMGIGPVPAVRKLVERLGLAVTDFDVIELNEAFASQGLAVLRELGIADDAPQVNPNGGAIALGHPLGMSGARLVLTALHQLEKPVAAKAWRPCASVWAKAWPWRSNAFETHKNKEDCSMSDKPGYRRPQAGTQPDYLHPAYQSTNLRSPSKPLVFLPHSLSEITGPTIGAERVNEKDNDLTAQHEGEPQGERIIIHGRVLDENGLPVPGILVEIWQANAAGRYNHKRDQHDAPLDPNFTGTGRTVTDADGWYQFQTIKPGAYPWGNHHNAWRPAHIHFSLFGPSVLTRLVTQMYFPGDPLLAYDPIYNCVPDTSAKERLIASFDLEKTIPHYALGYRWDIVLRGRDATPMEK